MELEAAKGSKQSPPAGTIWIGRFSRFGAYHGRLLRLINVCFLCETLIIIQLVFFWGGGGRRSMPLVVGGELTSANAGRATEYHRRGRLPTISAASRSCAQFAYFDVLPSLSSIRLADRDSIHTHAHTEMSSADRTLDY